VIFPFYANYFYIFSLRRKKQQKTNVLIFLSVPSLSLSISGHFFYFIFVRSFVAISPPAQKNTKIRKLKWHTLSREEQSRYYEMARQQRQLHMQLYPNWTMRDSVASGAARKRRNKRDKAADGGI
jgi:hypothetical protein